MTRPEDKSYVIIGAGPTGLGAARRLKELGADSVALFEKEDHVGGLAASFTDDKGFTWDLGGHVQFSHYDHFDAVMDEVLRDEWLRHQRESWVWIRERFIPYPFQNNIRHLPERELLDCVLSLLRLHTAPRDFTVRTFRDWILATFGQGIADHFMFPYNFKVWAWPLDEMSHHWTGDRVAPVDLERILSNIIREHDDVAWGPNNTFRFPLRGGTGEIWRRLAATVPREVFHMNKAVERLDSRRRRIHFTDGTSQDYDVLISTMPLDLLVEASDLEELKPAARALHHSTVHVVGVGLKSPPPPHLTTKCWMYFPENTAPFFRATVFSNYSPHNVPNIREHWSLILEVSDSPHKPVDRGRVKEDVVRGLIETRLAPDRTAIVQVWHAVCGHGYPTPTLGRDKALQTLLPALEAHGIYSRGRFGAWKYEVSNQDHSFMQGVEVADRLLRNSPELTLNDPIQVNRR